MGLDTWCFGRSDEDANCVRHDTSLLADVGLHLPPASSATDICGAEAGSRQSVTYSALVHGEEYCQEPVLCRMHVASRVVHTSSWLETER